MRDIVIYDYCDSCWADNERKTPAVATFTVACVEGDSPHPTPKVLVMCEECAPPIKALIALVERSALLPGKTGKATPAPAAVRTATQQRAFASGEQPVICPVCAVQVRRSSLTQHIWARHRPGEERPVTPLLCPDCRERFGSAQGITAHRRIAHGWSVVEEALRGVDGYVLTGSERDL